jgi:hypothetical protein
MDAAREKSLKLETTACLQLCYKKRRCRRMSDLQYFTVSLSRKKQKKETRYNDALVTSILLNAGMLQNRYKDWIWLNKREFY